MADGGARLQLACNGKGACLMGEDGATTRPGEVGIGELLSHQLRLARHLDGLVREHPDFEVLQGPTARLYVFRYVPNAWREEGPASDATRVRLDRLNTDIGDAIERSGYALVTTTRIRGRVAFRMSICSDQTAEQDVEATFEMLAGLGRRLAAGPLGATSDEQE